jgi:hypothetical protein
MSENLETNYSDYIPTANTTILGGTGSDTISFSGSRLPGGLSDHSQDFWDYDGISLTGNPYPSSDVINFGNPVPAMEFKKNISESQSFNLNSNTFTVKTESQPVDQSKNHLWKYNEDKILKEIEDYVTSTYHGHYCGDEDGYADIQTIDLMAAKKLAAGFCQANILKYGSRYGDKDGRNKRDLLKVIHYAMLLLHFDGHYSRKDNGLTEFSR